MSDAKRGFVPSDIREFGEKSLPKLRKAAEEVLFLLNHGYPVKGATRFVGLNQCFLAVWMELSEIWPGLEVRID